MNKFIMIAASAILLLSCEQQADIASRNVSQAADSFQVMRRITVINGITDKVQLSIEGYCSLGNNDGPREITITCRDEHNQYKKDLIQLGDNTTVLTEQLDSVPVSVYRYKVRLNPASIIPDITFQ